MSQNKNKNSQLTKQISLAMLVGFAVGVIINQFPSHHIIDTYFVDGFLDILGKLFITALKMITVPIVFVSIVCGTIQLSNQNKITNKAFKTIFLYLITTSIAITIALIFANIVNVGGDHYLQNIQVFQTPHVPSLKDTLLNIFPHNPFKALSSDNMLQIIFMAILFGAAINLSGESSNTIKKMFNELNAIIMALVNLILKISPIGVFCLIAHVFAVTGFGLLEHLAGYFVTVIAVLVLHLVVTYSSILKFIAKLSPFVFFKKMLPAMIFAFSTSSSNVSIPIVLNTVNKKLGVKRSIASFIIPLGATINMDGTAIMQGVATVFIANSYGITLTTSAFLKVILVATLASIGTAGIPSVGLITLTMVLIQVGLPVGGIALIIGVDRILDMIRTAVNITGDSMIACTVAKSSNNIDLECFYNEKPIKEEAS